MKLLRPISFILLLGFARLGAAEGAMPLTELTAGMYRIEAEVAATPDHRMLGLMKRRSMPANHGMLFIFTEPQRHCMWMKNTLLPLSVAFLDEQGRILNIEDMKPQTEDSHYSKGPALYALEMRKGWFAERGIGPGATVSGIPARKPVR